MQRILQHLLQPLLGTVAKLSILVEELVNVSEVAVPLCGEAVGSVAKWLITV